MHLSFCSMCGSLIGIMVISTVRSRGVGRMEGIDVTATWIITSSLSPVSRLLDWPSSSLLLGVQISDQAQEIDGAVRD